MHKWTPHFNSIKGLIAAVSPWLVLKAISSALPTVLPLPEHPHPRDAMAPLMDSRLSFKLIEQQMGVTLPRLL